METVIHIERRQVYGNPVYYPVSHNGRILAQMLDQKSLTLKDLRNIALLGFKLQRVELRGSDNAWVVVSDMVTLDQVKENLLR